MMRIRHFPKTNTIHIIDPIEGIEELIDTWRNNGNPDLEVHIYDYLPPFFYDAEAHFEGAPGGSRTTTSCDSEEIFPSRSLLESRSRGPSGFFGKDLVMD